MPRTEASVAIACSAEDAFALSMSQKRLAHFAEGCLDHELVARAHAQLRDGS